MYICMTSVMSQLQHKFPEEVVICLVRTRKCLRFNQINKNISENAHKITNKNQLRKCIVYKYQPFFSNKIL